MTPAERQYARNRATNTRAMGHTVTNEHALAADVLALDAELSRAEEEIRRLDHEASALEAETRALRDILRVAAAEPTT
jgi:predicted nuclease with TOPRIM domain